MYTALSSSKDSGDPILVTVTYSTALWRLLLLLRCGVIWREIKGIESSLRKPPLPGRSVRCHYFLSCRQAVPLPSGKLQVFSPQASCSQRTACSRATSTCKCHLLAAVWLAWAASLDSALLFCSVTPVNVHTLRERSYFQSLHIPARPISNCKGRIRQSYWSEADKRSWEWEGGKCSFVRWHRAIRASVSCFNLSLISTKEMILRWRKWPVTIRGLRNKSTILLFTPPWQEIY